MPRVEKLNEFPFDCVGLLLVRMASGHEGWGSGCLIDRLHVLTCGHNVFNQGSDAVSASFYPGYSSRQPPEGSQGIRASHAFVCERYCEGDRSWDLGVYRLEQEWPLAKYMEMARVQEDNEVPNQLTMGGYPSNNHYLMWESVDNVDGFDIGQHVLIYAHETEAGSSGSPLFKPVPIRNEAKIYGVHRGLTKGFTDKVGVLLTSLTSDFVRYAQSWKGPASSFVTKVQIGDLPTSS